MTRRPLRFGAVCLWLPIAGAGAGMLTACVEAPAARPPNIVFILADDLGYGDLGSYGQQQIRTPNLDQLAAEGVRFTQFYSGSTVCAPARNVFMTGQHVGRTLIRGNAKIDLRPEDVTVAEVLSAAGYETALVGKWGLGQEGSPGVPRAQGFDSFFGYLDQSHAHNYYTDFLVRDEARVPLRNVVPNPGPFGQGVASEKVEYTADLLADEAVGIVERASTDRPFFLLFTPTLPHANNEAREAGMEVPDYGEYAEEAWPLPQKGLAAMISRLDDSVGRLMATLQRRGLADDTIVLFSSDNGPHQEGGNDPEFFDSNGPLRGIKRDLYEGGIRVPLIVRWPGHVPAATTTDHVAYLGDFMATAAELAGVGPPPDLDSISFLPAALGDGARQPAHDYLYWEFYERGSAQAVRLGNWKAVRAPMFTGPIELYDLATDTGETRDVAGTEPAVVEQAVEIMERAHEPTDLWRVN